MNLQSITRTLIAYINPQKDCLVEQSIGSHMSDDGTRVPDYAYPEEASCQIQPISTSDLMKLDGLNMQGTYKAVYLNGNWEGVNRNRIKGGDKIIIDCEIWLVHQVIECWPDWSKVAVVLQVTR